MADTPGNNLIRLYPTHRMAGTDAEFTQTQALKDKAQDRLSKLNKAFADLGKVEDIMGPTPGELEVSIIEFLETQVELNKKLKASVEYLLNQLLNRTVEDEE